MPTKKTAADRDAPLRHHLLELLNGGHAHADFDAAVRNVPVALRGKRPKGAEHSPWEILEHLRIAQGTFWSSRATPVTNRRTGRAATGPRPPRRPMKRRGTKARAPFAAI